MSDESKDPTAAETEENKDESSNQEEEDEGNSSAANETEEDEAVASSADESPALEEKAKGKAPAKKPASKKKEPALKKVAASSPKAKPTAKKSSSGTSASGHPTYLDMAVAAIESLKERTGSSRVAILRYIMKNYNIGLDEDTANVYLKQGIKRGIISGILKNTTVS